MPYPDYPLIIDGVIYLYFKETDLTVDVYIEDSDCILTIQLFKNSFVSLHVLADVLESRDTDKDDNVDNNIFDMLVYLHETNDEAKQSVEIQTCCIKLI